MVYNLTPIQNSESIPALVVAADGLSGNVLMILFILAIFFVSLLILKRFGFVYAWVSSTWGCFVLSSILALGGFINIIWPLGFLAGAALGTLYLYAIGQ